jgi:hypothetical protein
MNKLRGLGVAVVFLAGCAVGGASGRFVVPPANAQQAATLTKWEYMCFSERDGEEDDSQGKANAAGLQGWEMAGSLSHGSLSHGGRGQWCFKRLKM